MEKLSAWLFLLAGIIWLLPLISVNTATWGAWIISLIFIVIGITEVMKAMKK